MTDLSTGSARRAYALPLAALTLLVQASNLAWPLALLWLLDVAIPRADQALTLWLLALFLALGVLGLLADWGRRHMANRLALVLAAAAERQEFSALIGREGACGASALLVGMPPSQRAAKILANWDAAFVWAPLGVVYLLGGWLAAVPASACLVIALMSGKGRAAALCEAQAAQDQRLDLLLRIISQIHVVKAMGIARQAVQAVVAVTNRLAASDVLGLRLAARSVAICATLERAVVGAVVTCGFYLLESGALTMGGFAACLVLSFLAVNAMRKRREAPKACAASKRENKGSGQGKKGSSPAQAGLALADVAWRCPRTGEEILSEASALFAPGSCTAILGENDGHVSALLEIMAGRIMPDRGFTRLDGGDIRSLDAENRIILVKETPCLFEGTLFENLTGFSPELEARVQELAKELGLESWLGGWKQGMKTKLCQTATDEELSPGRRQLIGLVQALAREPAVLLLDHADRHLDAKALRRLVAYLNQRKGRMTLVLASDNIDMLALADGKLALTQGKLQDATTSAAPLRRSLGEAARAQSQLRAPPVVDEDEPAPLSVLFARAKKAALIMALLSLATGTLAALPALLLYWLASGAWIGDGRGATSLALAAGLVPMLGAELLLRMAWARKAIGVAGEIGRAIPLGLFKRLMDLPLTALETSTAFHQIAVLHRIERWRNPYLSLDLASLPTLAELLAIIALLFFASPPLAALACGYLAVVAMGAGLLAKGRRQALALVERQDTAQNAYVLQTARIGPLASSGKDILRWRSQFAAKQSGRIEALAAWLGNGTRLWLIAASLRLLVMLGVLWLAGLALPSGLMTQAGFLAGALLILGLFAGVESACARVESMAVATASLDQCGKALRLRGEDDEQSLDVRSWDGGVEVSSLSFSHPGDKDLALDNISMQAAPGKILAVAGIDGCGKSTLLKSLLGLYPPKTGGAFIAGIRLDLLGKRSLRKQIAYLSAKPFIFPGSVADNLRLGNPRATAWELEQAAESLGVLDDIQNLRDGFDTSLCESGLSWSVIRKIELARLALTPAVLFLLDEPSQGLDPPSREALLTLLRRLKGRGAVVVATRDDSLVRQADEVGIMERGRLTQARIPAQSEGEAI